MHLHVPVATYYQMGVCSAATLAISWRLNKRQAAHQKKAAQHLHSRCQTVLSSCATSISTDEHILQQQHVLTPRHAQAVEARLEHKLLIATAIELLKMYTDKISTGAAVE